MNNNKKNFWLDMAMLIIFVVIIFTANSWLWLHVTAGLILSICLIFHIVRHWWWFGELFRTGRGKSGKVPRNRAINIGLLIVSALTIMSGIMTYAKSGNLAAGSTLAHTSQLWNSYPIWRRLHEAGVMVMLALVVGHFTIHWNWLVSVARSNFRVKPYKTQK